MNGDSKACTCPEQSVWDKLATDLIQGAQADELLFHASQCEDCAASLRDAIEIFADSRPRAFPWALAAAAMITALLLGGVYLYWRSTLGERAVRELAIAYSARRTLELRIPGASYGQLRTQRGAVSGSIAGAAPELLEAAARIGKGVAKHPNDPAWLHAEGRLSLLEWRSTDAIRQLEVASDLAEPSTGLLIDLATAYYERAVKAANPHDFQKAQDLLGRALHREPENPAALFNKALIEEQLQEAGPAIDDLEKLLRVEPKGPWAEETRAVLDRIRKTHSRLLSPLEDAARRFPEIELDRELAKEDGLSQAFAESFLLDHHDPWPLELVQLRSSLSSRSVSQVLSSMASIRLSFETGLYQSLRDVFASIENVPQPAAIDAWRNFEALYRATHMRAEFRCLEAPEPFVTGLEAHHYYWLESQALRELGYCAFQGGDIFAAEEYGRRSVDVARKANLPLSDIRSSAILAHANLREGRIRDAVQIAVTVLNRCQEQQLPVARAHEFFNILLLAAQSNELWHAARSAAASLVEAATVSGFRDLQFTNAATLAQMTMRSGDLSAAGEIYRRALAYYAGLAPSVNRAWVEIGFADATSDESRLSNFASTLENATDPAVWVPYQRVRARIALEQNRLEDSRARLARIWTWMENWNNSEPISHRWRTEFRAATEVNLRLLEKQGRLDQSLDAVEHWRAIEDRTRSELPAPAHDPDTPRQVFIFATVGDRFAAWRLTNTSVDFRWSPMSVAAAGRLTRRFDRLLASDASSVGEISDTGNVMQLALFGDWLDHLPDRIPVLIQAEGSLSNIPFAALPGFRANPLALTSFAIDPAKAVYSPREERHPDRLLLLDGTRVTPSWETDLIPLPGAGREIQAIRELAWTPTELVDGASATPEQLAAALARTTWVHFAGHTISSSAGITLALTSKGLLDLASIPVIPASIVLSACSSGRRDQEDTDLGSPESLASSFLEKGSREVIASLWDVDSGATEVFMRRFYSHLHATLDSGSALALAQEDLRRSGRFSHPYYWAGFTRFVRE